MTVPHLMNCQHTDSGWCAECVAKLGNANWRLREALTELRDRIKDHPAYADLTMKEEIEEGGDTAEFSYLARVADAALRA